MFVVCVQPLIGQDDWDILCVPGAQRSNEGSRDSLLPPLRGKRFKDRLLTYSVSVISSLLLYLFYSVFASCGIFSNPFTVPH